MTRRAIAAIAVLLAAVGVVVWFADRAASLGAEGEPGAPAPPEPAPDADHRVPTGTTALPTAAAAERVASRGAFRGAIRGRLVLDTGSGEDSLHADGDDEISRRVSCVNLQTRAGTTGVIDSAGSFVFFELPAGTYSVESLDAERVTVDVRAGRESPVTLRVRRWVRVRGRVVDATTSAGIAGATVVVTPRMSREVGHPIATTDEQGYYRIAYCAAGRSVGVRAAGFEPGRLHFLAEPPAGRREVDLVFRLRPGGRQLRGLVVDARQRPVSRARVRVMEVDGSSGLVTRTTVAGRFDFTGVGTGECTVAIEHGDYAARRFSVPPGELGVTDLRPIVLTDAASVVGVVRDEAGAVVAGAAVWYGSLGDEASVRTRSGPDGSYRLRPLPPGDATISATLGDTASKVSIARELRAGNRHVWDPILREPADPAIAGVVDTRALGAGSRAEPWIVAAYASGTDRFVNEATTDRSGAFRLRRLPDGAYDLAVRSRGAGIATRKFGPFRAPHVGELVLRLSAGDDGLGAVKGTIRIADGREIIGGCAIARVRGVPGDRYVDADPETGEFLLPRVPCKPLEITIRSRNAGSSTRNAIPVEGTCADLGIVTLDARGCIRGEVICEGEIPMPRAVAAVSHRDFGVTVAPVRGGVFAVTGPLPGTYTIRPIGRHAAALSGVALVEVAGEREIRCELRLRAAIRRTITCGWVGGRSDAEMRLVLRSDSGCIVDTRHVTVRAATRAEVPVRVGLDPGKFELTLEDGDEVFARGALTVENDVEIAVRLAPAGGR